MAPFKTDVLDIFGEDLRENLLRMSVSYISLSELCTAQVVSPSWQHVVSAEVSCIEDLLRINQLDPRLDLLTLVKGTAAASLGKCTPGQVRGYQVSHLAQLVLEYWYSGFPLSCALNRLIESVASFLQAAPPLGKVTLKDFDADAKSVNELRRVLISEKKFSGSYECKYDYKGNYECLGSQFRLWPIDMLHEALELADVLTRSCKAMLEAVEPFDELASVTLQQHHWEELRSACGMVLPCLEEATLGACIASGALKKRDLINKVCDRADHDRNYHRNSERLQQLAHQLSDT